MKYTINGSTVDAIQFQYTTEGVTELELFCGPALGTLTKHRHPRGRGEADLGYVENGVFNTIRTALEGEYIVKTSDGELYNVPEVEFTSNYVPVAE